jgi:hypothetical protein
MGGWGVLDYALNFTATPAEWLQLGYASYLSSFALINSGTAENNYGYWFPGKEHDGAAGWQFMSAKAGSAWMGSSYPGGVQVPRGPWHYDGEIDLGFGGALRMARTVVTNDPLFGWLAYGGSWEESDSALSVVPRDGIRKRFDVVLPDPRAPEGPVQRLAIQLERDGFAREAPITVDKRLERVGLQLENRTADSHTTELSLRFPYGTSYTLLQDGRPVPLVPTGNWDYPWRGTVKMGPAATRIELVRTRAETHNPTGS